MQKVLYIKANIKPEGQSRTYKISDNFIEEYKKNNPQDDIITLDCNYSEPPKILTTFCTKQRNLKIWFALFSPN